MKKPTIVILVILLTLPLTAQAYSRDADETPPTPETGYYYDPATGTWYYYNGLTITAKPPGFVPPPGQGTVFELTVFDDPDYPNNIGWRLYIEGRFIGPQTIHYEVESSFVRFGAPWCPLDSSTGSPPCLNSGSVSTTNYLLPGPTVLSAVTFVIERAPTKPNTGEAEAWGWLGSIPHDRDHPTYYGPPISW